jgi:hypothetical protein
MSTTAMIRALPTPRSGRPAGAGHINICSIFATLTSPSIRTFSCGTISPGRISRGLPILLEETLTNTLFFLEELVPAGVPVIIPHLGALSGGYHALDRAGVWGLPQVYADSAVADLREIEDYLSRYGHTRLLYGSDFPFSLPGVELQKILDLNLPRDVTQAILGDNFRRLCHLEM